MYIYKYIYTCNFIHNIPYRSTTYIHHFPDKRAGHNGVKLIVTNLSTTIKVTQIEVDH